MIWEGSMKIKTENISPLFASPRNNNLKVVNFSETPCLLGGSVSVRICTAGGLKKCVLAVFWPDCLHSFPFFFFHLFISSYFIPLFLL